MSTYSRRSLLSALGLSLPFGLGARAGASTAQSDAAPLLRFRPFEEAVRAAFAGPDTAPKAGATGPESSHPWRRVEVGDSDLVRAGVQGCHNDRPFAGFPAGHLRIVRTGSEPGPVRRGVRLYITTVDIALTGGPSPGAPSRPLDFAMLPPAPTLS